MVYERGKLTMDIYLWFFFLGVFISGQGIYDLKGKLLLMLFSNLGILIWAYMNGNTELFIITVLMLIAWITRFKRGKYV